MVNSCALSPLLLLPIIASRAECISFEGPNSRGMLVPLEELLLKDNLDGTISVFFRRQFRRKVCHHIITQEINYDAQVTGIKS